METTATTEVKKEKFKKKVTASKPLNEKILNKNNLWQATGKIVSDLELKTTSDSDNKKPVVNFKLEVSQPYKIKNKEGVEETKYKLLQFPCTAWNGLATYIAKNVKRNDSVKLYGLLRTFNVKTNHKKTVLTFEIVAQQIQKMTEKK
ncbi:Ssb Single-stranded DNA-binding protein [uncultured Caudovirales phage]|uniref:Ssb Single-stranded DNA-binding protein n=1 Tax=uncultured Caudovirales phage TaxID=2100421 RepID=A0A6J5NS15_9CAUD|nr:Ssb Single-stranded DNA-binding protein [uncultured Caudovirales phage]